MRAVRCCSASIVVPCLPIRSPRSSPFTVAAISSSVSTTSTEARSPSACVTRATTARTRSAGSSGSSDPPSSQSPGSSTVARTRASLPLSSSPSSSTSNSTSSASMPGNVCSSALSALHFASPREVPAPSAASDSPYSSPATRAIVPQVARGRPATRLASAARALLLLARRGWRRPLRPAIGAAIAAARALLGRGCALRGAVLLLRARRLSAVVGPALRDCGARPGGRRLPIAGQVRFRRWQEPPDEQLVSDRPTVRGDPVDQGARLEVDDDRDEQEREEEQQPLLVLVLHVERAHVARRELRADVEHDHHDELRRVARQRLRDVRDEEELAALGDLRLKARAPQGLVEPDEERDLEDQRQTRAQRIDLVLFVELHHRLLLALLVVLVALLDLLHLRLQPLKCLHRAHLLEGERQDQHPDDHRQPDDRSAPAQADVVVPEPQHGLIDVDQRLEDVR